MSNSISWKCLIMTTKSFYDAVLAKKGNCWRDNHMKCHVIKTYQRRYAEEFN